ncbi:glycosyltransferase family 4 protein [Pararhizobium mangrovi]|uniref:Glycosyltransferase family 4 protein n=1 Tax=Pararhizobium mangrovi TaxID=2590452 RepID=A0A506U7H0_9HYPH|nr:glycosyltransferase family 4 protein [Pararhizobium mangrovi]TPW30362.1 glycosyltransferase family 4 protein [Pararhizobium mangrovi]
MELSGAVPAKVNLADIDIVAPHFKRRLSGVTSTVVQLVPCQRRLGTRIAVVGPGLPSSLPHLGIRQLAGLWRRPNGKRFRVWHARRNVEMAAGIVLRDVLRMPIRLLFTSAAQRHHKATTRWMIARMDAVVATSARSGGFLRVEHSVIRHGIDTEAFHPGEPFSTEKPYRIGCSGRIRPQKGTDLFVDTMIALLPDHPDWQAEITGRATPEHRAFAADLKERIRAAGLAERIRFLGEIDDIKPWYRALTLFVAPSRNEGFGLTPLEAMASGTAVVTSNAGAYDELVDPGKTGTVAPAGDGEALREAIRPYLDDPAVAHRYGSAGARRARAHFRLEQEAQALAAIYERLQHQPSGHRVS